jgi:hypothetical protein
LEKESVWRRRLGQQIDSGQSVRAWCREHRVTETAFYWWRRELARRDGEQATAGVADRAAKTKSASFVPVRVAEDEPKHGDWQIEIVLTDGRRVRISGVVDQQMLTDVLDVLERRAC